MTAQRDAAGLAALSICEALLITLIEKRVLNIEDVQAALEDAAAAHQGSNGIAEDLRLHHMAVHLVERIITQLNAADPDGRHV
jgi:hypothetical protein